MNRRITVLQEPGKNKTVQNNSNQHGIAKVLAKSIAAPSYQYFDDVMAQLCLHLVIHIQFRPILQRVMILRVPEVLAIFSNMAVQFKEGQNAALLRVYR